MGSADVLIIGGGVIGLSVAEAALRRGLSVTLLERERLGSRASWAGAGMLQCHPRPSHKRQSPDHVDLTLASIRLHEQWAARLIEETEIDPQFWRCGTVELFTAEEAADVERLLQGAAQRGIRTQRLSRTEVKALEPALGDLPEVAEGILFPDDAQVRPPRLLKALAFSVRQQQANVKEGVAVADLWIENGRALGAIAMDGTRHAAGSVVVCAGAWAGRLPGLAQVLPRIGKVEPVRGQVACYSSLESGSLESGVSGPSHVINFHGQYLVPRRDGVLLAGSTTEKVGFESTTTELGIGALRQFAARMLPALNGVTPVQAWADLRPGLKGTHPMLGPVRGVSGLFVAAGHYKNGLCLAPVSGEAIAALLAGQEPPLPVEPWAP
ncbi:MAG TPA: FAD-dependent oxidoreductase [Planctomycetota bacterium]|jgi:glycine oxidase